MSKAGDPRLGTLFNAAASLLNPKHKVAILGYPVDEGVRLNNGRVGAAGGPEAIRKKLTKLGPVINPEFDIDLNCIKLVDRGNISISKSLEECHVSLKNSVTSLCDDGYIGIIIGGGNDQSYCNARGLMNSLKTGNIGVVNIDAHLDVRPLVDDKKAHSGSPFRQLLEDVDFKKDNGLFYEFAVQGNQCSKDHANFVKEHGGRLVWLSQLRKHGVIEQFEKMLLDFGEREAFISFDIDSIRGADCPGVSCPAVIGLSAQEALDICFMAGKHEKTKLLDLSEYNPKIEEDRTARLVVNMIYYFLMGVASRPDIGINNNII